MWGFLNVISTGVSFTHNVVDEACNLLEKISENTNNRDLDKHNETSLNFEYSCVNKFSPSTVFDELRTKFNLYCYVIVEVSKAFASHVFSS
jgi:hypothetical protein